MGITDDAHILWNHLHIGAPLAPADALVVLGSQDTTAPVHAAALFHQELAPLIICSGKAGKGSAGLFTESEAAIYKRILLEHHVPEDVIYLEDQSTNSGENIAFTQRLIDEQQLPVKRIIFVHKPYMERRVSAAVRKQWPSLEFQLSSLPISLEEYLAQSQDPEDELHMLVGDVQRMHIFVDWGFHVPDPVPADVWAAYERLVAAGYTKYILPEQRPW